MPLTWRLWDATCEFRPGNPITGAHRLGYMFKFIPTFYVNDALSFFTGASYESDPYWTIWQGKGNLVGAFDGRTIALDSGINLNFGGNQELRMRLQALGVGAHLRQAYEVAPDGSRIPTDEPVADFGVRNLGFQVRYRYEFAPLSNLYIVYNRGGYDDDPTTTDAGGNFRHSFNLRQVEQALVKVAYRLEF